MAVRRMLARARPSSPTPLSSRHLGERGANLGPLAFLAYLYALQRLGQQGVEHLTQHALQHRLPDGLALDRSIWARRVCRSIFEFLATGYDWG